MTKYQKFQDYLVEKLCDPKEAQAFLDAAIEEYENDGDTESFMLALRYLTEAKGGVSKLAEATNLNRQNLSSRAVNPRSLGRGYKPYVVRSKFVAKSDLIKYNLLLRENRRKQTRRLPAW